MEVHIKWGPLSQATARPQGGPLSQATARPQVADGGDGLQIWRVPENILSHVLVTIDGGFELVDWIY
jgi:hypothetical protein